MNVIDNLHPISPVGGGLPAGGFAHAGHAYYTSLITPFVTGDFLGVPQPSNYANKMKQPIIEAPSVTWKSSGPGRKRLKLVKKTDGSYGLGPEDDSFDGFIDYGGDERQAPPPPPPPGLPTPVFASNGGSGGSGSLSVTTSFPNLIGSTNGSSVGSSLNSLVSGSSNFSVASYPSGLLDEMEAEFERMFGATVLPEGSRSSAGSRDSLYEHMENVLRRDSSTSLSAVSGMSLNQYSDDIDMLMDQTLPGSQVFAAEKIKTPSLASSTTETSGPGPKSSSSDDNQPGSSTPAGRAKSRSPNTVELLAELDQKHRESYFWGVKETSAYRNRIKETSAANIQKTPLGAEAFSNDWRTSPDSPYVKAKAHVNTLYDELSALTPFSPEYTQKLQEYLSSVKRESAVRQSFSQSKHLAKQGQALLPQDTPMGREQRKRAAAKPKTELSPEALKDLEAEKRQEALDDADSSYDGSKKGKGKGKGKGRKK